MYCPLNAHGIRQLVPIFRNVLAHPPAIHDGAYSDVWTNPGLYGYASLHDDRQTIDFKAWAHHHGMPALIVDNLYDTPAYPTHNAFIAYNKIHVAGSWQDYLDRLNSRQRRKVKQAHHDKGSQYVNFEVYPLDAVFGLVTMEHMFRRSQIRQWIENYLLGYNSKHLRPLFSSIPLPERDDVTLGILDGYGRQVHELQTGLHLTHTDHWCHGVKLLVISQTKDSGNEQIMSVHLVAFNEADSVLHSFARFSLWPAREALVALIQVAQQLKMRHVDVTNVDLSDREQYKRDFFTSACEMPVWISESLIDQRLPFLTPC